MRRRSVPSIAYVLPILPGKSEAWRRFVQDLQETRREPYEESRRRLNITREQYGIAQTARGDSAVIAIESAHPSTVLPLLAASADLFDRWYRQQLLTICGVDLSQPSSIIPDEMLFVWSEATTDMGHG